MNSLSKVRVTALNLISFTTAYRSRRNSVK
jgi:hypothetical protein